MKKFLIFLLFLLSLTGFHFFKINQVEKETALNILDSIRIMELEVTPDEIQNGDKLYFSPRKYARRTAFMDAEQLIYEKYRLWQ
jgi:hypothetical protein